MTLTPDLAASLDASLMSQYGSELLIELRALLATDIPWASHVQTYSLFNINLSSTEAYGIGWLPEIFSKGTVWRLESKAPL